MSKIITLVAAGYVNAIAGDVGKQVQDDTVEIGVLLGYNNISRLWWVDTDINVASGSAMTITAGTGEGTSASVAYCSIAQIKERLLISADDVQYDTALTSAAEEASRYVDEAIRPFEEALPLTVVPEVIADVVADISSAIFKRRHMPKDFESGWWLQGIKKLEIYIESNYLMSDIDFTWDTQDANQIMSALDKKIINLKEARSLLKALTWQPTSKTDAEIALINKQIELITAQIAKIVQEGLLVEAQTNKVESDILKITAEISRIDKEILRLEAETLNVPKLGLKIDAETGLITAETTKLSGADTDLITEQIAKLTAEVTKLSGVDTDLTSAQKDKIVNEILMITAQIAKLSGVDTDLLTAQIAKIVAETLNVPKTGSEIDAQTALLTSQKAMLDKQTEQLETIVRSITQELIDTITKTIVETRTENVTKTLDEEITFKKNQKDAKVIFSSEE